jgi:hypothetical protein
MPRFCEAVPGRVHWWFGWAGLGKSRRGYGPVGEIWPPRLVLMLLVSCMGWDLFATVLATPSTLETMQAETVETELTFLGNRGKRTVTVPVFV